MTKKQWTLLYHGSSCFAVLDHFFLSQFDFSWLLNLQTAYLLIVTLQLLKNTTLWIGFEYYFLEIPLSEGLTSHTSAFSQWHVTEVYVEPFLFICFSILHFISKGCQKATVHHLLLTALQVCMSRYMQYNCTLMQKWGVLSQWGVLQNYAVTNTSFQFTVNDNNSQEK